MTNANQIGTGRPRPVYQPLALICPSCGAGLTVQSEHAQQVTCGYCNERIDCSSTVAKALGKTPSSKDFFYDIELNQIVIYQSVEYVVIARMTYVDSDMEMGPCDYLLFHPHMGTLWMTADPGSGYYLTFRSRMIPPNVFSDAASKVEMPDGSVWKRSEQEIYTLTHVDGALPWKATVGDRLETVELQSQTDRRVTMAIERSMGGHEVECSISRQITDREWMTMLGKQYIEPKKMSIVVRFLGLVLCVMSSLYSCGTALDIADHSGESVLSTTISGEQLSNEVVTPTFEVNQISEPVSIRFTSHIDNEWLSLNYAILSASSVDEQTRSYAELLEREQGFFVDTQTTMMDVGDLDLSYYYGYDGGESWSEGKSKETQLWMFPKEGTYRLLIQGVSGTDELPYDTVRSDLDIQIHTGQPLARYYTLAGVISLLLSIPFLLRRRG